jgi:hypothetical protein
MTAPATAPFGSHLVHETDEISCAFAQIKSGLSILREEVNRIDGNIELEERLIFLVDALEALADAGNAANDRLAKVA